MPIVNPQTAQFSWVDPTKNTDGSAITAGEITGYQVGVRSGGVAGTYPILLPPVNSPAATTEALSAASPLLVPGDYSAAVKAVGAANSAWSAEIAFTIAPSVPNPPTGFTIA